MQLNSTQITVVIPLYNKALHIIETLKSVLAQTLQPQEIIVVDDGSTDMSAAQVLAFNHPAVRLIRQPNSGVSVARNTGILAASTEFIALLDADDQWLPHFLEEMTNLIHAFPEAGLFSSSYQYRDDRDRYSNPRIDRRYCPQKPGFISNFFKAMAQGDLPVTMSSVILRRSLFDQIGGFPVGETMGEDQDFLFRAALALPIAYSPKVLAIYVRDSDNRACVKHLPTSECPFSLRLAALVASNTLPAALCYELTRCRAAHVLHLVKRHYAAGQYAAVEQLLENPCCKTKPGHYWLWKIRNTGKRWLQDCVRLSFIKRPMVN